MNVAMYVFLIQAWASTKPGLYFPYLAHYAQSLLHAVWKRRAPNFIKATTGRRATYERGNSIYSEN